MGISQMLMKLAEGMATSCWIFGITLLFSLPLGMVIAFGLMSKKRIVQGITKIYISIMRGTPLMLQLMVVYFGPYYLFGIKISPFYRNIAVVIGFVLNYAAYFAEIFRGGILAIPKGQYEAAKMLKLSPFQTIRYIILPQVVKIVLPSIFNEIINLVKDSSLVYVLGVGDLLLESRTAANRDATLAPMFVAGAIYLILVGVVTVASKNIEKKFNYYK